MFLQPKKTKYAKMFKGRNRGLATRGCTIAFGTFGICATKNALLTARQIESARRAIAHYLKRVGKLWIRIFPDKPVTKKPLEVRQGKGKGSVSFWAAVVKPGTVLFELTGIPLNDAKKAFQLASSKLPMKTSFITKV